MIDIRGILSQADTLVKEDFPGYRGCSLRNATYVIAYEFESGKDAELFKLKREAVMGSSALNYEIYRDNPNIVFERRTYSCPGAYAGSGVRDLSPPFVAKTDTATI